MRRHRACFVLVRLVCSAASSRGVSVVPVTPADELEAHGIDRCRQRTPDGPVIVSRCPTRHQPRRRHRRQPAPRRPRRDTFIDIFEMFPIPDRGPIGDCANCVGTNCGDAGQRLSQRSVMPHRSRCTVMTCLAGGIAEVTGGGGPTSAASSAVSGAILQGGGRGHRLDSRASPANAVTRAAASSAAACPAALLLRGMVAARPTRGSRRRPHRHRRTSTLRKTCARWIPARGSTCRARPSARGRRSDRRRVRRGSDPASPARLTAIDRRTPPDCGACAIDSISRSGR